jgi:hypothetical protein
MVAAIHLERGQKENMIIHDGGLVAVDVPAGVQVSIGMSTFGTGVIIIIHPGDSRITLARALMKQLSCILSRTFRHRNAALSHCPCVRRVFSYECVVHVFVSQLVR